MVPSMCIPAARKKALKTFSQQEQDLITNGKKIEIRFASIEFFKKLFL